MEENLTRILGLDVGDSRIGVAMSDPLGILASPFMIVNRTDEKADIGKLVDIIIKNQVSRIIVGLPLSMDGSLGQQAEKTKDFISVLRLYTDVPVEFRDERLSTVSAKRTLKSIRKAKRDTRYDAMAAALVLQAYLDEVH